MSVNIKNPEVERLLAELRDQSGKGTTEIVLELTRREVARRRRLRAIEERRSAVDALTARYRARLLAEPESPDAILGYDQDGLPR